ncbi:omega-3 polyunsaturated fatty acid synthase subunit [Collimonas arenae]|uniref:Omega-3 polyunsaturated fatty acid synthase subunit n=2 Tax=Collimonas arenae TaxID=279058 RepID=A0A0A1F732_9BURK|nr:omega-3 polyunsaturated fatty acid synthase subunit [Collimonas arenae]
MPKANSLKEYWSNILNESECLETVPSSRWRVDDYFDADPSAPDRTYSDRGGFIPDIAFDPMLFGMPPKSLASTDAAQIFALAVGRQALIDAGYNPDAAGQGRRLPADRAGIVLGVSGTTMKLTLEMAKRSEIPKWIDTLRQAGIDERAIASVANAMRQHYPDWTEDTFPGFLANVVAGRIANRFGLGAASYTVDAACASSLSAVRLACQELRSGAADIMVTGGVDTDNSNVAYLSFSKTPALSKSGKVRSFDADADGTMISEGVGMLVLKRLDDAIADKDRIYGVIRGLGASTDAAGGAIYAPRSSGQIRALQAAYADAGFDPQSIGLIEAHATGTVVGDAVEIESLESVFDATDNAVALGSVKAQIGHTKAAAGAASLIKTVLALYHKVIPPTMNVQAPNPRLNLDNGPFYLPRHARPWLAPAHGPRRAGVSVFGFGGANLHVALEEHVNDHPLPSHQQALPILLSAATPAQLALTCRKLAGEIESGDAETLLWPLAAVPSSDARIGLLARSREAAPALLRSAADMLEKRLQEDTWSLPTGVHYRRQAMAADARVVAVFSGQGSQTVGMGARLSIDFPQVRKYFEAFDAAGKASGFKPVSSLIFAPDSFDASRVEAQRKALTHTLHAQTAIGAYSMSAYSLLRNAGFTPAIAFGHSFGELTALWAAGVFSDQAYRSAVLARGDALTPPPGANAGSLIAISAAAERVTELLPQIPGLAIANLNSPRQTVAGGSREVLTNALEVFKRNNIDATPIPVAAAFHTEHVNYAAEPWHAALANIELGAPALPVLANLNAQHYPADASGIRDLLARQPFAAVQFRQQIEAAYAAGGRIFVEIGPRAILTRLVDDILGDRPHVALPVAHDPAGDDSRQIQEAMVRLAVLGQALQLATPAFKKIPASALSVQIGAHIIRNPNQPAWPVVEKPSGALAGILSKLQEPAQATTPADASAVQLNTMLAAQNRLAEIHQDFLDRQATLAHSLAQHSPSAEVMAEIQRNQASINAAHAAFMQGQQQAINQLAASGGAALPVTAEISSLPLTPSDLANQGRAPQAPAPAAQVTAPADPGVSSIHILQLLTDIVAEKTGFPASLIEAQMSIEGDLGVDSIKRVEILSAMRTALGALPAPEILSSARNLAELAQCIAQASGEPIRAAAVPVAAPVAEPVQVAATAALHVSPPEQSSPTASVSGIGALLLSTVADKTGYPVDMLSLDMRLEADLGVDSIKRVEILSFIRDTLGLQSHSATDQLRNAATLADIAALLGHQENSGASTVAVEASAPASVPVPVPATVIAPPAVAVAVADKTGDVLTLLLQTVADKTGFPADMLSAEMRLEADLGVDSIKRVEILSAVRDTLGIAVSAAASSDALRNAATLAAIAELLSGAASEATAVAAPPAAPAQPESQPVAPTLQQPDTDISNLLLATVAEKTGYPVDMLSLDMRLESDLGVDSIKRVEILSSVRDTLGIAAGSASDELRSASTLAEIAALLAHGPRVQASVSPWQPLPVCAQALPYPPQPRNPQANAGKTALIFSDGGELGSAATDGLLQAGYRPLIIRLDGWMAPNSKQAANAHVNAHASTHIIDASIDTLAATLTSLAQQFGTPAIALLLQATDSKVASRNRLSLALRTVRVMLPWLDGRQGRLTLLAAARLDGKLGSLGAPGGDPVAGGLAGLIKTLRLEAEGVAARFVDLAPELSPAAAAQSLLAEMHDADHAPAETGWTAEGRWTLASAPATPEQQGALPPLRAGDLVLVTGGARGVTAHCVQALAATVAAHFVLIGRTPLVERDPAWAENVNDPATLKSNALQHLRSNGGTPTPRMLEDSCRAVLAAREVRLTLQAIAAHGAQATYLPLDLGDVAATRSAIAALTARHGPVAALVHGAGALADRKIADKTEADVEIVFRPKLDGFLTLLEALRDAPPARTVLFSSTAGVSGNVGQADYAMANEALSKLAFHLPHVWHGTRVVALAWGPWEGGMVTPALKKMFAERGIGLLPIADGASLFAAALSGTRAGGYQFVVGDAMQAPASGQAAAVTPTQYAGTATTVLAYSI